jgi:hypothetical protein
MEPWRTLSLILFFRQETRTCIDRHALNPSPIVAGVYWMDICGAPLGSPEDGQREREGKVYYKHQIKLKHAKDRGGGFVVREGEMAGWADALSQSRLSARSPSRHRSNDKDGNHASREVRKRRI